MLVYITTRGHGYTLRSLSRRNFGFPTPRLVPDTYERLFGARRVRRATYIFADLERLSPWELTLAADLFRSLQAAGLRCLNDPAYAMSRVELLHSLKAAGINPFDVMRGDERPCPTRFPVFLRFEMDHHRPISELLGNQAELDKALHNLRASGVPLRGTIVVEHCTEPYHEGLWYKWGTFRVAENYSVDHITVDDNWCVKYGDWAKLTDAVIADEHEAVKTNRFAPAIKPAFDIARIDFGRADHCTIGGRVVVYEINTNPYIGPYVPDPKLKRRETQSWARRRFAEALQAIDTEDTGTVRVELTTLRTTPLKAWRFGWLRTRP
jgi:hypothetical protein